MPHRSMWHGSVSWTPGFVMGLPVAGEGARKAKPRCLAKKTMVKSETIKTMQTSEKPKLPKPPAKGWRGCEVKITKMFVKEVPIAHRYDTDRFLRPHRLDRRIRRWCTQWIRSPNATRSSDLLLHNVHLRCKHTRFPLVHKWRLGQQTFMVKPKPSWPKPWAVNHSV